MLASLIKKLLIGVALAINLANSSVAAENWPNRTVVLVAPFGAGGVTDVIARTVAKQLQEELGQPVVVENKPGASGNIAASLVARAKPDGYTLMLISNGMVAVSPLIQETLNYDAFKDFVYISMIAKNPLALVVSEKSSIRDLRSLMAQARQQPDGITFASSGIGTSIHQTLTLLQQAADTTFLHVPYKSGAEAVNALLSGDVQVSAVETVVVGPYIESGRMRALGVTSDQRVPRLSGIPTITEQLGVEFDVGSILGLVAPKDTPASIIKRLESVMAKVVNSEDMQNLFARGSQPTPVGSEAFQDRMRGEVVKWEKVFGAR
ncbi:tripartite tricarboxylate transporter family receptor [Bordetella bronchiseptica GA96-01]|uniref:Bug family tripartite tricarboxylate transporter substrate binding protein n=1 Tax=Bordetella bronchiseptica TaxID=518 RepID=UPI00045B15C7|nr:tripartite tricarboxylate transporter substrate binding protein [Bordetella bronchiseptica]AZW29055.1 tripartite tricarboxylate transporter substrate binding protein [Bordetella bronchiseptica]KCV40012.1 tripartite tricarboxylate transporter family receptor [Bordetella bronchiseptica 345]KDC34053.1 tripartite tricarboxylate transporter family receptor [Bordetella bronchiseptica GA96-01]